MLLRRERKGTKWRPGDGTPDFTGFSTWPTIEPLLPAGAPMDARAVLEAHGRRLWERRSGRSARVPASALKQLVRTLRAAAKAQLRVDQPARAALLDHWSHEAEHELGVARAYEGQRDPDREEFLFAVLREYQGWGGDLGCGKHYIPRDAEKFLCAVCAAVLGREAPRTYSRIVARFRRVHFAAATLNITAAGRERASLFS